MKKISQKRKEGYMIQISDQQVKKIQVNIVKEIDRICSENGLRYFLAFGS